MTTTASSIVVESLVNYKEIKTLQLFDSKWQKQYFRLIKDGTMAFYRGKNEKTPISIVNIADASFQDYKDRNEKGDCVRVNPKKKNSFCFSLINPDAKKLQQIKDALKSVGATELAGTAQSSSGIFTSTQGLFDQVNAKSVAPRSQLEVVDVEKWTIDQVLEWLSYLRDSDGTRMSEKFGEIFKANDVDGKTLVSLDDTQLKALGISSLGKRVKLLREIEKLKNKRKYYLNEHLVFSKFEKMDPKFLKNVHNIEDKVQSLCDVDEILKTYLSSASLEQEDLKKIAEEEKEDDQESFQFTQNHALYKPEQQLKVKLIVTEIAHTDSLKTARKLLSPVISGVPSLSDKFGMFHTSLIVGPWFLEWTDSALCIPKKISSSMALLTLDVDVISLPKQDIQSIARKIAEVVVDWNVNFNYCNYRITGKKEREGNCQDFVNAVLDKLEIQPTFTGALQVFLEEMRTKGNCEMEFKPDAKFQEAFALTQSKYTFQSHAELDLFIADLIKKRATFKLDYPSEVTLLKSFDRGFWLRHLKKPDIPLYQPNGYGTDPKTGEAICSCPFNDPRKTETFYVK